MDIPSQNPYNNKENNSKINIKKEKLMAIILLIILR